MTLDINRSGITASHLQEIKFVAQQYRTFIFVRPVNPHATDLIESGLRTKGLDIHAKSSDWGPMAGFVCIDSSLSKVVGNTDKELSNDSAVRASLSHARVGEVPLELSRARIIYLRNNGFPEIDANVKSFKSRRVTANSRDFRLVHQPSGKYRVQVSRDKVFQDVVVMGTIAMTVNPSSQSQPIMTFSPSALITRRRAFQPAA